MPLPRRQGKLLPTFSSHVGLWTKQPPNRRRRQQQQQPRRKNNIGAATTFLFAALCSIAMIWYHTVLMMESNDKDHFYTSGSSSHHHQMADGWELDHSSSTIVPVARISSSSDTKHENPRSSIRNHNKSNSPKSTNHIQGNQHRSHNNRSHTNDDNRDHDEDYDNDNHDNSGTNPRQQRKIHDFTKPELHPEAINLNRRGILPPKQRTYKGRKRLLERWEGNTPIASHGSRNNNNNNRSATMATTIPTTTTNQAVVVSSCSKWGVVVVTVPAASSFDSSSIRVTTALESIRRVSSLEDWCVVVVADHHDESSHNMASSSSPWHTPLVEAGTVFVISPWEEWYTSMSTLSITHSKNATESSSSSSTTPDTNASTTITSKVTEFVQLLRSRLQTNGRGEDDVNHSDVSLSYAVQKNMGYLYAISRGAQFLFDFDPDIFISNHSTTTATTTPTTLPTNTTTMTNSAGASSNAKTTLSNVLLANDQYLDKVGIVLIGKGHFNPYPLMEASAKDTEWPRGFPLSSRHRLNSRTDGTIAFAEKNVELQRRVAVISQCVNDRHNTFDPQGWPILVPPHTFVPYTSSSTIHTPRALWASLLPTTVPRGVSDIWRAYSSEALFRELDLRTVISSSAQMTRQTTAAQDEEEETVRVRQETLDRQYFNETTDMLLNFLNQWTSPSNSIPVRMEQLWIDLYERGYIEEADVHVVQLWWENLLELGYYSRVPEDDSAKVKNNDPHTSLVPRVSRYRRHFNVAFMGQFNYALDVDRVLFWHQKWREVFHHVVARGPFNKKFLQELRDHGLEAYPAQGDKGYASLVQNYRRTLLQFEKEPGVEGVLHLHDDAMVNMRALTRANGTLQQFPFPTGDIIVNRIPNRPFYMDPRTVRDKDLASLWSWKIYPNGTYLKFNGEIFPEFDKPLRRSLEPWAWYGRCFPGHERLAADPASAKYRESDGTFLFAGHALADFLFLPMKYFRQVDELAELFLGKPAIFHECATPTIVDKLRHFYNATVRVVPICTDGSIRNTKEMVLNCLESNKHRYAVMHPFKLSQGFASWDATFDALVRG
jgi:hypothetical protein